MVTFEHLEKTGSAEIASNVASLLFSQLSRVLRLLKYPAENSENPPQVNMSPFVVSQVCLEVKPDQISAQRTHINADHLAYNEKACWLHFYLTANWTDLSTLSVHVLISSSCSFFLCKVEFYKVKLTAALFLSKRFGLLVWIKLQWKIANGQNQLGFRVCVWCELPHHYLIHFSDKNKINETAVSAQVNTQDTHPASVLVARLLIFLRPLKQIRAAAQQAGDARPTHVGSNAAHFFPMIHVWFFAKIEGEINCWHMSLTYGVSIKIKALKSMYVQRIPSFRDLIVKHLKELV